ncbi:MAG: NAD(+) kinase [Acidobacteria bacterium]|nr:MAG: NAD(+) kinase [Acidobacteriota bacterium]
MRRVGLLFKKHDPRVPEIVRETVPWLRAQGAEVLVDEDLARQLPGSSTACPPEDLAARAEAVAVFGGDGTLLYAARLVAGSTTPILGINLGSLGFLTEVKLEDTRTALEALLSGRYALEERMLLDVDVLRGDRPVDRFRALNDVVINKGALARIIEMEVTVDGQLVAVFRADGLILSTPTGSTAYSLSAGGPVLHPTLEAFIITPICPHTLTNRPVVVSERSRIAVTLRHGSDVMLTVDGQVGIRLEPSDRLMLARSGAAIRLVQPAGNRFFKVLREKLKWG